MGDLFSKDEPSQQQQQQQQTTTTTTQQQSSGEKLQGTLILTIQNAIDLFNSDALGFSDPYVLIHAVSGEQRPLLEGLETKTIEDNLKPVWNERFSIIMEEATSSVKIDMEVFDRDTVGKDQTLGFAEVEVTSDYASFDKVLELSLKPRNKGDPQQGKMYVKVEYRMGRIVKLNEAVGKKKDSKDLKVLELPGELRSNLREWRAAKDVLTDQEEEKLKLLSEIFRRNFNFESPIFQTSKHKFAGFIFEYQKANHVVGADDLTEIKWNNMMKSHDGDFVNEAKDIVKVVCDFQTSKKSSYRDGYLNDPEGLFCEELKTWSASQLSIKSIGKDAFPFLDQRISYLEECLLVPDLFDTTSTLALKTCQQMIVEIRRILKYRAFAAVEKELAHEDATRSFNDLKKHLAGLVRCCAQFLKNVFKCEVPPEILSTADRLMLTVESDPNIRAVLGDELKTTMESIRGIADNTEAPWHVLDLGNAGLRPTMSMLDPATLDIKDPILLSVFNDLPSGVEEFFRNNPYIAYHFLRAHGLLLEAGRLFVVIEKAANCAKTGGTLLVFGLANAQLNATLDSTKAIMDVLKEEFNTVTKIAECCFEELVFANQATKERTAWIKFFKNVFPGINEINDVLEKIQEEVAEIKQTANSMTLYERFQQAADENKEFLQTADQFSQRMAAVTGKPYVKPKPKEMTDDDQKAMMKLIQGN